MIQPIGLPTVGRGRGLKISVNRRNRRNGCYPLESMVPFRPMTSCKVPSESKGTWIVKDVPRDLMHRMKVAAAIQKKTVKQLLFDLAEAHLLGLERKGILPKGK